MALFGEITRPTTLRNKLLRSKQLQSKPNYSRWGEGVTRAQHKIACSHSKHSISSSSLLKLEQFCFSLICIYLWFCTLLVAQIMQLKWKEFWQKINRNGMRRSDRDLTWGPSSIRGTYQEHFDIQKWMSWLKCDAYTIGIQVRNSAVREIFFMRPVSRWFQLFFSLFSKFTLCT
jgi:hypothetical protein